MIYKNTNRITKSAKFYIYLLIHILSITTCSAELLPQPGIEPSKTVPILYINTENQAPIDQKEEYIPATAWLDASMSDRCESVGDEDKTIELGIRGRGNASWLADGPKPYKMKFDKKQSFFGLTKNKHWVLLPIRHYAYLYNDNFGLELGRRYQMPFLPKRHLVEVVLNDIYIGAYMLSEHIRVDEGRVEITEQPDLNEDDETIPYGWLVEIDNYSEPNQIRLSQPDNSTLKITPHSPEVLSEKQQKWLQEQFKGLTNAVYNQNKLSRDWEEYVDIDDWAKHFLVQESLHNFDAYSGSCYLHKDTDEKWHFGPLWDVNWSLDRTITSLICEEEGNRQKFVKEIIKFPRFRNAIITRFAEFIENNGTNWIEEFEESTKNESQAALTQSKLVWPSLQITSGYGLASSYLLQNIEYLKTRFETDLQVHQININTSIVESGENSNNSTYNLSTPENESDKEEYGDDSDEDESNEKDYDDVYILFDGLRIDDVIVNHNASVTLSFCSDKYRKVTKLIINGEDLTDMIVDGDFTLDEITEDQEIFVTYGDKFSSSVNTASIRPVSISVIDRTINIADAESEILIYSSVGHLIYTSTDKNFTVQLPQGGVYFIKIGNAAHKVFVK